MEENKIIAKVAEVFDANVTEIDPERYDLLVDDLKEILVEGIHNSRYELVKMKWHLGQRIMAEFQEGKVVESYKTIIDKLGKDLKTSMPARKITNIIKPVRAFLFIIIEHS